MISARRKAAIECLLADFGYVYVNGGVLIQKGVRGFTADTVIRRVFRDVWDVFEYLTPRILDDDFYTRIQSIRNAN